MLEEHETRAYAQKIAEVLPPDPNDALRSLLGVLVVYTILLDLNPAKVARTYRDTVKIVMRERDERKAEK